jgi:hypothetical protein
MDRSGGRHTRHSGCAYRARAASSPQQQDNILFFEVSNRALRPASGERTSLAIRTPRRKRILRLNRAGFAGGWLV